MVAHLPDLALFIAIPEGDKGFPAASDLSP